MFCVRGTFGAAYSSPSGGGTLDGAISDRPARATGRNRPLAGLAFEARSWFALLLLSTCIIWFWPDGPENDDISGLGERVVPIGSPAPKGGGHFKIGQPYEINGEQFIPQDDPSYDRTGVASWYGALFHGRHTANGEIFDMERLSAAHPTLPLPVYVKVTNLDNGRSAVVRVNDRGPFRKGREIDLSERTAEVLGFKRAGTANVRVRYLRRAPMDGDDGFERDYLSTRGFSQYAGSKDEDGVPEVVIAVGPLGCRQGLLPLRRFRIDPTGRPLWPRFRRQPAQPLAPPVRTRPRNRHKRPWRPRDRLGPQYRSPRGR